MPSSKKRLKSESPNAAARRFGGTGAPAVRSPAVVIHDYFDRRHPHHDASVVGLSYIDDPFSVGIRYHYLSPVAGNRVLGLCRFDIHDRRYQVRRVKKQTFSWEYILFIIYSYLLYDPVCVGIAVLSYLSGKLPSYDGKRLRTAAGMCSLSLPPGCRTRGLFLAVDLFRGLFHMFHDVPCRSEGVQRPARFSDCIRPCRCGVYPAFSNLSAILTWRRAMSMSVTGSPLR